MSHPYEGDFTSDNSLDVFGLAPRRVILSWHQLPTHQKEIHYGDRQ